MKNPLKQEQLLVIKIQLEDLGDIEKGEKQTNWSLLSSIRGTVPFISQTSSYRSNYQLLDGIITILWDLYVRRPHVSPHPSGLWCLHIQVDVVLVPAIILHTAGSVGVHVGHPSSPQRLMLESLFTHCSTAQPGLWHSEDDESIVCNKTSTTLRNIKCF